MTSFSNQPRVESAIVDQHILGESIRLPASGLVAKTRFLKGAMSERLASWDQHDLEKRGIPSDPLIRVYEEWGKGGYGIILTGNTQVTPIDLEAPGNTIVYKPFETPERFEAFRRQATAAKAHGSLIVMQISHAGRQVAKFLNPNPISASDVHLQDSLGTSFAQPRAMTLDDIETVIDQFAYGAEFAYRTGYNGVQLHAAHGYLLAQFLATTTNKRTDEYGGSLHNRARIIYRIIEEIKRRVNDSKFSISIKINSAEFQKGGFQPDECKEVCQHLEEIGIDWVELSGGTYEEVSFKQRETTKAREAFFLEFAEIIRPALKKVPVFVTGGFQTAAAMVKAIQNGSTDGIGLGRPACEEPDLPNQLISGKLHSKIASRLDYNDFVTWISLAGSNMRRFGFGMKPFDSADEKVSQDYEKDYQSYVQLMGKKLSEGVIVAGHPRFGTPALSWENY